MNELIEINSDIKSIIATNITKYRKQMGLTQLELAEKLNYSDKTLSKWERAESVPDVITLKQLADLFGISVDILISEEGTSTAFTMPKKEKKGITKSSIVCINLLSLGIVWLVATFVFVVGRLITRDHFDYWWLSFIYAIPVSAIVLLVFSCIWGNHILNFVYTSILIWTFTLALHLSIPLEGSSMLYLIPIPLEIMAFIFFIIFKHKKKSN